MCDVADSTKWLNSQSSVDSVEQYLPRLMWIGTQVTESAGGRFVKWTGDGFFSWFPCDLERNLGSVSAAVFDAAWLLSYANLLTNLDVAAAPRFQLRHGIAWEPDALVMHPVRSDGSRSTDMLGRGVVTAFRLSSIRVDFPSIVTHRKLQSAARREQAISHRLVQVPVSEDDALKYFKGERPNQHIYASSQPRKAAASRRNFGEQVNLTISAEQPRGTGTKRFAAMLTEYVRRLRTGPAWAKALIEAQLASMRTEVAGLMDDSSRIGGDAT